MELYDIVLKLTGDILPYGDSSIDEKRWQNLNELCKLVISLTEDIKVISNYKDRPEFSMKNIGALADRTLLEIHEIIS